jgi:histidine triad (HIT) family protein
LASIFIKIIQREIPAEIIAEDDRFIAFLDIMPLVMGHTLVVPKQEVDYLFDLDNDTLGAINIFAKQIAKAVRSAVPCKRIGVAVIGLEVPHAHMHLVPLNTTNDINFMQPKLTPTKEELSKVAAEIRRNLR